MIILEDVYSMVYLFIQSFTVHVQLYYSPEKAAGDLFLAIQLLNRITRLIVASAFRSLEDFQNFIDRITSSMLLLYLIPGS